jgi:alcohol dehydrogenase, propanol-preferring
MPALGRSARKSARYQANREDLMKMPAARMYGYHQPWRIEEVPVPEIGADEVLVKVTAAGMCRSDFQLADGYFKDAVPQDFPITPGHEIAGHVARVGASVPGSTGPV